MSLYALVFPLPQREFFHFIFKKVEVEDRYGTRSLLNIDEYFDKSDTNNNDIVSLLEALETNLTIVRLHFTFQDYVFNSNHSQDVREMTVSRTHLTLSAQFQCSMRDSVYIRHNGNHMNLGGMSDEYDVDSPTYYGVTHYAYNTANAFNTDIVRKTVAFLEHCKDNNMLSEDVNIHTFRVLRLK